MIDNYEIPISWIYATIDEVISCEGIFVDGDWIESKDQDPNGNVRLIQLADIGDGKFKDKSSRFLSLPKAVELNCTFLQKGDILVARMPYPIGRACLFPLMDHGYHYVTAVDVAVIRIGNNDILNKFLVYAINSPLIRNKIENLQSGTTRKRISRKNLATIKFPIPPAKEQYRIIEKIEELFSELDKGIESLKTAQQQLKVYRQAVLKWAFEGKLTEKWRNDNKPKLMKSVYEEIQIQREKTYKQKLEVWGSTKKSDKLFPFIQKPKKASNLQSTEIIDGIFSPYDLPKEWILVPMVSITADEPDAIVDGPFGSSVNVNTDYVDSGVPVIRMVNIRPFRFVEEELKFIKEEKFQMLRRHNIVEDDILLAKVGATIGDCCRYPCNKPEAMLSTTGSCRVRPDRLVMNNKYLEYYLNYNRNNLRKISSQTAQPFLNMKVIKSFPVILSTLEEQYQIIQEIESRLSVCDKIEETIEQSLKQAEALRQSILKKAFEGKLVPQDPNDEPASKLLERISAAKQATKNLKLKTQN